MKKLLLLTFVFMFAFNTVSFAAVSGSKPKMSAPKPSTTQKAAPSTNSSSDYKPSAPAQSYGDKAPAAAAKPNTQTMQQPQQSGGFLKNMGLFGGGMLLGSMLGGMFGFGEGMFSSIMGMLFNVILLAGIFMAGRFLWDKFKNRDKDRNKDNKRY